MNASQKDKPVAYKISKSGIFSYALSLIYTLLAFILTNQNKNYLDYGFIILHLIIIFMGIFIFSWIYLAIFISFKSPSMKKTDKKNVKTVLKTFPHRIILSLLYWLMPIGMYIYNINNSPYFYIFKWMFLWFPMFYLLGEKYIIWKEKKINSPLFRQNH